MASDVLNPVGAAFPYSISQARPAQVAGQEQARQYSVDRFRFGNRYMSRNWGVISAAELSGPWECCAIGPTSSFASALILPQGDFTPYRVGVGAPLIGNFDGKTQILLTEGSHAIGIAGLGHVLELLFYERVPPLIPTKRPRLIMSVQAGAGGPTVTSGYDVSTFPMVEGRRSLTMFVNNAEGADVFCAMQFLAFDQRALSVVTWPAGAYGAGTIAPVDDSYRMDRIPNGGSLVRTYEVPVGAMYAIPIASNGQKLMSFMTNSSSTATFIAED